MTVDLLRFHFDSFYDKTYEISGNYKVLDVYEQYGVLIVVCVERKESILTKLQVIGVKSGVNSVVVTEPQYLTNFPYGDSQYLVFKGEYNVL